MTENGWQVIGRLARARRERLGLRQEQLRDLGGPGVVTVGKIERAAQATFPLRTQQQMEKALGWARGTIHDVVEAVDQAKDWDAIGPDWEVDLVERDLPDLTKAPGDDEDELVPAKRAAELSDAELLAELTYRVRQYAQATAATRAPTVGDVVVAELGRRGRNPGWLMDATGLAVDELMPVLGGQRPPSTREVAAIEKALGWAAGALSSAPEQAAPAGGQATGTTSQQRRDRAV